MKRWKYMIFAVGTKIFYLKKILWGTFALTLNCHTIQNWDDTKKCKRALTMWSHVLKMEKYSHWLGEHSQKGKCSNSLDLWYKTNRNSNNATKMAIKVTKAKVKTKKEKRNHVLKMQRETMLLICFCFGIHRVNFSFS